MRGSELAGNSPPEYRTREIFAMDPPLALSGGSPWVLQQQQEDEPGLHDCPFWRQHPEPAQTIAPAPNHGSTARVKDPLRCCFAWANQKSASKLRDLIVRSVRDQYMDGRFQVGFSQGLLDTMPGW